MTIPHAEHPSSLILKPFSFPIPLQDFSESCLSSDGQFTYPVNKFRVFPNPASRVKSRIPRNFFQTLQDQLGVYICCIHAYDKASALQGIWAYWDIVPLICSIYHVDRKTSIDLVCKDTEEGRVDVMKTFGSFYVSALLVSKLYSFLASVHKYIQHCKSYFKNQNYIKGQLVSVLLCLDRVSQRTSSYVFPVRNCHLFIHSFIHSFVRSFARSFFRSFIMCSCIHPSVIHQFLKLTLKRTKLWSLWNVIILRRKKNINRRELNRKQRCLELCGFEVCSSAPEFYWLWMVTKLSNSWNISCVHGLLSVT